MNNKLKEVLDKHERWLRKELDSEQAIFTESEWGDNLQGADFSNRSLSGIIFKGVDLSNARFENTNLNNSRFIGTGLDQTNFGHANLRSASFTGNVFTNVWFVGANCSCARFNTCVLYRPNFSTANLFETCFDDTILEKPRFFYTNLYSVDFSSVQFIGDVQTNIDTQFYDMYCPEFGGYIAYKIADGKIIKLYIPPSARRSSATTKKCRTDKALVISITSIDGKEHFAEAKSNYDKNFIYRAGELVKVDNFDENRWRECAPGIHHFMRKEEAIQYGNF